MGSAVWRFCERCAGGDRPVCMRGRGQVEPAVWPGAIAASRLRRTGSGAFECAHRTIFAVGGAGQYPNLPALECGAVFPPAAAAGAAQVEEAAGGVHAEEHAAASRCPVSTGRSDASAVSAGDPGHRSAGRQADSALHREDRTRTSHGTAEAQRQRQG